MNKKKKKKKKWFNKLILIGLVSYFIYNFLMNIVNSSISTSKIEYGNVKNYIKMDVLLFRNEHIIEVPYAADVMYLAKDGQRISKDENIAFVANPQEGERAVEQIQRIEQRVSDIRFNANYTANLTPDQIENQIFITKADIKYNFLQKNYENVNMLKNQLINLLQAKSSYDKGIDLGNSVSALLKNKAILEHKINMVKSDTSGFFSSFTDGLEKSFLVENMQSITPLKLDELIKKSKKIEKTHVKTKLGKIIEDHYWYFALKVDNSEAKFFDENKILNVELSESNIKVKAWPISKNQGKEQTVIILKSNDSNTSFCNSRIENLKVIYKNLYGIKIPKKSVINKDGKKGVLQISETGVTKFKPLEAILGESKDFYVLDYRRIQEEKLKTVKLYDEVVTNTKGIHEGQKIR